MTNRESTAQPSIFDSRVFPVVFLLADFLVSLWVFRPRQYFFYADSWDVLHQLLADPKTILRPHNEHFMPLFKAIYFLEYKAFGGHHLPYMIVALGFHAGVTLLVYLLGRRLSLNGPLSVAAALIFSYSSVHWEVTGWSFEQSFELSTLITLAAVWIFLRDPHEPKVLTWVVALNLIAFWCGPIAVVLPPCLTVYFLLWTLNRSERSSRGQVLKTFGAIWLPFVLILASVRTVAKFSSLMNLSHARLGLLRVPAMVNYTLFGAGKALVLRSLTFVNAPGVESEDLILILFVAMVIVSYQGLKESLERVRFWFLISLILFPYLAASVIRLQFGIGEAATPRYTYFPLVALALLMCLCWSGLSSKVNGRLPGLWLNGFGFVLLCYYLAFHITVLHRIDMNPALERGREARAYMALAEKAAFPKTGPGEGLILVPEIIVPPFVYYPGALPLWVAFDVLEGNPAKFVPIRSNLEHQDGSMAGNLIRNGGFEAPATETTWKVYGKGSWSESAAAAHNGKSGIDLTLGPAAAFSPNARVICPGLSPQRFYTFSIQAKTKQAGALVAHIIFKDAFGKILETAASPPIQGDNQWDHLLVSGLTPLGTCIIDADVTNVSYSVAVATIDDAILVAHPATADSKGDLHFASPTGTTGSPFWPEPVSIESGAGPAGGVQVDFDGAPGLQVHAPGRVVVEIPDHAKAFKGFFGLLPGAYTGVGKTAGVEFSVDAELKSGKILRVFDRFVQPLTQPTDRGRLAFMIHVDSSYQQKLILTTSPAPRAPNNWDWAVWANCRFNTAQTR